MATHLDYSWYQFDLPSALSEWLQQCVQECINLADSQPYDSIFIRAKRHINGRKEYKVIFRHTWITSDGKRRNFPVCYVLDPTVGKFKGNKMNYYIDNERVYSQIYPIYNECFKFGMESKFNKEKRELLKYLDQLDIPVATLTGHEKRYIAKKKKQHRAAMTKQTRSAHRRHHVNRVHKHDGIGE